MVAMGNLDYDRLHGIWAGLPVAWDASMELDESAAAADVEACCRAGVHGVYTGGTTGEFYAQDEDTFRRLIRLTVAAARFTGTPMQAGCTSLSTRLVCRRIEIAGEAGADGIQLALPFWLPLSDEESIAFFRDVTVAASGLPLILYDTERTKRRVSVELFRRLREVAPTLIGCKHTGDDMDVLKDYIQALPGVSFFVSEHLLPDGMRIGARGNYSSKVYLHPPFMLRYYQLCVEGCWDDVAPMQAALKRFYSEGILPLRDKGMVDSAIDRVFGTALGFVRCGLRCQPPYVHATQADVDALVAWMRKHTPILLG